MGSDRTPEPILDHFWNDPDGDGHNCVDCDPLSVWKCDRLAHPRPPKVSDEMKRTLAACARARAIIAPPNRGLA